jgi:hypothetical protein
MFFFGKLLTRTISRLVLNPGVMTRGSSVQFQSQLGPELNFIGAMMVFIFFFFEADQPEWNLDKSLQKSYSTILMSFYAPVLNSSQHLPG